MAFVQALKKFFIQWGGGDWADSEASVGAESHSRNTREEQLSQAGSCHPTQGSAEYFSIFYFETSVQDTDPDPDATGLRIRIRILLCSSVAFKMATKNNILAYYFP